MPLFQAATTTASGCVLGNEDGMASKWGLFPIIGDIGRFQSFVDKITSMLHDLRQAFFLQIVELLCTQMETLAEGGFLQCSKNLIQRSHEPCIPKIKMPYSFNEYIASILCESEQKLD